ncbi:ImuA family protein [Lichenihabitans psoromatis]|uniref:ImuA family protein n=1 Tax=Lichenihabitans psoromatis TaxID=2528642 RepID=UPI001035A5C0|nr:hypothetical protein [Lichenihabitans psoromatis]
MSPSGRTEHVTFLRAAIARIEAGVPAADVRAMRIGTVTPGPSPRRPGAARRGKRLVPLGSEGLDGLLGGGLRAGALHEIVPETARDEAAASGFALAVASRCLAGSGMLIWIVDDRAASESGDPYRPGLQAHGLDPDRMIVVRTHGADQTLWALEEALRAGAFTVLAELWGGQHYGLAPSRRLVLAARARGGTGLLLHAGLPGAATLSSGSETRFAVAAHPSPHLASAGGRMPIPGQAVFGVRLDKLRNAATDFDTSRIHPLVWTPEQRCFHDHDLSLGVAFSSADRSPEAARPRPQAQRRAKR